MKAEDLKLSSKLGAQLYRRAYLCQVLNHLYSDNYRKYHTLDHIQWCLNMLGMVQEQDILNPVSQNPQWLELELGILFHDAVCVPGRSLNEILSADIAYGVLSSAVHRTQVELYWVQGVIRSTASMDVERASGLNPVEKVMRDIDHSILASERDRYQKYCDEVREEYRPFYSEEEFRKGRIKFVEDMLQRARNEKLFLTNSFKPLNAIASNNLRLELENYYE